MVYRPDSKQICLEKSFGAGQNPLCVRITMSQKREPSKENREQDHHQVAAGALLDSQTKKVARMFELLPITMMEQSKLEMVERLYTVVADKFKD